VNPNTQQKETNMNPTESELNSSEHSETLARASTNMHAIHDAVFVLRLEDVVTASEFHALCMSLPTPVGPMPFRQFEMAVAEALAKKWAKTERGQADLHKAIWANEQQGSADRFRQVRASILEAEPKTSSLS
jgi:hypothetical protein